MPHPQRHQAHQGAGARDGMSRVGGGGERFRGAVRAVHSLVGAVWEAPGIPGRGEGRTTLQRRFPRTSLRENLLEGAGDKGCGENTRFRVGPGICGYSGCRAAVAGPSPTPAVTNSAPNSDRTCYENFSYPPLSDVLVTTYKSS